MSKPHSSPFMEKVSGAVSGALSEALDRQSSSLAAAKKYQERFLSNNRVLSNSRVYLAEDVFSLITRMVAAVGKDKVSLGGYVTEIVREHMERYKDSISTVYLTNTQPLF